MQRVGIVRSNMTSMKTLPMLGGVAAEITEGRTPPQCPQQGLLLMRTQKRRRWLHPNVGWKVTEVDFIWLWFPPFPPSFLDSHTNFFSYILFRKVVAFVFRWYNREL